MSLQLIQVWDMEQGEKERLKQQYLKVELLILWRYFTVKSFSVRIILRWSI